jgi:aldehyde dehydrogenase (NAD+)
MGSPEAGQLTDSGMRRAQNTAMQLNYIANTAQASCSGLLIPILDPSDGQVFDQIQRSNASDIDDAVRAAHDCLQRHWRQLSAAERGRLLMLLSR